MAWTPLALDIKKIIWPCWPAWCRKTWGGKITLLKMACGLTLVHGDRESLHFSFIPVLVAPHSHYSLNICRNDHMHDQLLSVTLQQSPAGSHLCPLSTSWIQPWFMASETCYWQLLVDSYHFGFCPFSFWWDLTRRLRGRVLLEHKLNCKHFGLRDQINDESSPKVVAGCSWKSRWHIVKQNKKLEEMDFKFTCKICILVFGRRPWPLTKKMKAILQCSEYNCTLRQRRTAAGITLQ